MVGLSGLEPLTSRLSGARSNQLSYRPTILAAGEADMHRVRQVSGASTAKAHEAKESE